MRDILKSFARPGSQVAALEVEAEMEVDDDAGEWITVVSKFHFVDLAGSERVRNSFFCFCLLQM